ncbi:MAG: hypothetical protein V1682_07600 [Candidatus Omnitrophota bacterium]
MLKAIVTDRHIVRTLAQAGVFFTVAIAVIGACAYAYAADGRNAEESGFVAGAISDIFDKVDKVTSGEKPLIESVDDYEMDSSGRRIPKNRNDDEKKTALEEKLGA